MNLCIGSSTLQLRMKVADAFLAKFQLSEGEMKALRGVGDSSVSKVRLIGVKQATISLWES